MFDCLRKCTVAQGKGWPLPSHSPPGQPEPGGRNEEPECLSIPTISGAHPDARPGPAFPAEAEGRFYQALATRLAHPAPIWGPQKQN